MKFGKHFKVVKEHRDTEDCRFCVFEVGEVVYFVKEERGREVFSGSDGWLLRLRAEEVPQYLEAI
jgi:hypothetical protein